MYFGLAGFGMAQSEPSFSRRPEVHQANTTNSLKSEVKELRGQMDRLVLLNQALWELLEERTPLTEAMFLEKVREVDLRDGTEDGKITDRAVRCPKCQRVCNSRHPKCIYCGMEFATDLFKSGGGL